MTARRIVIVGASGQIGSALMDAARSAGRDVVGTAHRRSHDGLVGYDMRVAPLRSVVPSLGPDDAVFLLAAHIQPTWIYANQAAARELNLDASKRLADEALGAGARLVFMSTNLVFDGEVGGYSETAVPRPLNLYGRLKVAMEEHILAAAGEGIVARTGFNVAWQQHTHCAVAQCYENLLKPGARMAVDNVVSISDVDDTARALLALAGSASLTHRIYHLVGPSGIARSDLAATIKASSRFGAEMHYEIVPFASISYTEPRPTRAFLTSERPAELGVRFMSPVDVIRRKVALLDGWRSA